MPSTPYAVIRHGFPFRALAARVGRARLGGEREVALACLMAARLAAAALPAIRLAPAARAQRAARARTWFASLSLPASLRAAVDQLGAASASDEGQDLAAALRAVADAAARHLDRASQGELERLIDSIPR